MHKSQKHKIVSRQGGRGQRGYNGPQNTQARGGKLQPYVDEDFPHTQPSGRPRVSEPEPSYKVFHYPNDNYYDSEQSHNHVPDYERYGDYGDETGQVYQPMPKKGTHTIKYRLKTFDDEHDSDVSLDETDSNTDHQVRRGPKLIKFKQKKPSERLSQLKAEKDDKNDILDLYTPQNTQKTTRIEILKPYKGFEKPEFFQGPQWKYIR